MNDQDAPAEPGLSPELQELLRLTSLGEEILNRSHEIRDAIRTRIHQLQEGLDVGVIRRAEQQEPPLAT